MLFNLLDSLKFIYNREVKTPSMLWNFGIQLELNTFKGEWIFGKESMKTIINLLTFYNWFIMRYYKKLWGVF